MDMDKLELYQDLRGVWRKEYTANVTQRQMDAVRKYFIQNCMGFEEKEGVFRVTSPFLGTAVKELRKKFDIRFVEQKARLVE